MKKSRQLLSIVIVFFWASEYCHVPYFTPYLTLLGFSMTAIGFMVGVYGFTQMIVRIPLGIYTDVSGSYKGVVVMGTLFTTVSSLGLIFAQNMWFVILCRFLAGIAASTWIAFTVLYSAYYEAEEGVKRWRIFRHLIMEESFLLSLLERLRQLSGDIEFPWL